MPRQKIVDNVYIDLTPEEEAELDAQAEAIDLDMSHVRAIRNSMLSGSDWTRLDDASLGDHTSEEWRTYRQALKDIPQNYTRVSTVVWPEDPPTAKITRKRAAGDVAYAASIADGDTIEQAQAAYDAAYAATD